MIWDQKNFDRVTLEPKNQYKAPIWKTSYKDLVFAQCKFLSVVGAQNESLRIVLMYYIEILIWDHNNFARVTSETNYLF